MLSWLLRRPYFPLAVFFLATVLGGLLFNSVHAHGRLVAEGTGDPITQATLSYGVRRYAVNDQGEFDIPDLPRGARITALAPGWTRKEFSADETEVKLTVGVVNFNVFDATNDKLLVKPEARDGADHSKTLGVGTDTGSIAVPQPPPDIFICAKDYAGETAHITKPVIDVKLQPKPGDGCPVPPPPSPSPSPSASGSPAASPTSAPSSTP